MRKQQKASRHSIVSRGFLNYLCDRRGSNPHGISTANVNREDAAILLAINAVSDQLKKQKELDDIRDKNKFDGK